MKYSKLLIIEDEEAIRDMLQISLEKHNFTIFNAENTESARLVLANTIPDLILLDWMLPGQNGVEFIQWLRNQETLSNIPIIMVTAKAEEASKVKALTIGADDYITKPFSILELVARIYAILRRGILISPENEIRHGQMTLNLNAHQFSIENQALKLLPVEYKLICFFFKNPDKTYTRNQLIDFIYGRSVYIDDRTIDVNIKRLREKLRPFHCDSFIKTVRGIGYRFQVNHS